MSGQDLAVRGFLEVHHVERVGRARDRVRPVLQERGHTAERGDVRAGGDELQELAAGYFFGHTGP
jgi:hypothetical protein